MLKRFTKGMAIMAITAGALAHAGVTKADWGKTTDGTPVQLYTLTDGELTVTITTFGARVVSIMAPDRSGKLGDVVLGYDNVAQYEADKSTYFGSIVGRYGNRIAKGQFTLDSHTYTIPANDHGNALHGGPGGFSTKVWTGKEIPNGVEMTLISPDGDMGFPGTLTLHVKYTLENKSLHIHYAATTTKPTVINVTNHTYFNLTGDGKSILGEEMMIPADRYTPTDAKLIPTGELAPVEGTPFDFRNPKGTAIGARIHADDPQLKIAGGYDHNWVLNSNAHMHVAAHAYDPASGRTLTVTTTEPGVQFYSGNFLDGTQHGKYGVTYEKNAGYCLETQHFPDSPNHPSFPSTELLPGHTMESETIFTFGVRH